MCFEGSDWLGAVIALYIMGLHNIARRIANLDYLRT